MKYGSLVIEKKEYVLLKRLMNLSGYYKDNTLRSSVKKLVGEMETARILDEAEMPDDVIRFNAVLDEGRMPSDIVRLYSEVTLVGSSDHRDSFRLVPPGEEDPMTNQISVTSSLGASLIGFSKGDRITYGLPGSKISFTIEKVKQGRQKVKLSISDGDMQKMVPEQ